MGNGDSPEASLSSILHNMVSFDKHHLSESPLEIAHALHKLLEGKVKWRQATEHETSRSKLRLMHNQHSWWTPYRQCRCPQQMLNWWSSAWNWVGGDTSLFTRTTDPHNPWRIAEILNMWPSSPNLSEEQQNKGTWLNYRIHRLLCFVSPRSLTNTLRRTPHTHTSRRNVPQEDSPPAATHWSTTCVSQWRHRRITGSWHYWAHSA